MNETLSHGTRGGAEKQNKALASTATMENLKVHFMVIRKCLVYHLDLFTFTIEKTKVVCNCEKRHCLLLLRLLPVYGVVEWKF